jgi:hypothetical protein
MVSSWVVSLDPQPPVARDRPLDPLKDNPPPCGLFPDGEAHEDSRRVAAHDVDPDRHCPVFRMTGFGSEPSDQAGRRVRGWPKRAYDASQGSLGGAGKILPITEIHAGAII